MQYRFITYALLGLGFTLNAGCSGVLSPFEDYGKEGGAQNPYDRFRPLGSTSFVSADGQAGEQSRQDGEANSYGDDALAGAPDAEAGGGEERTVEEGDIYRVLEGSKIANLNAYRGLQIIDFANVNEPEVIGRLQISGYPVELYVVGDVVFVLMNNWYGYYGSRLEDTVEQWYGGVAIAVDISDPTSPTLLSQARIPGNISKSRLTRQGQAAALYVATGGYGQWGEDGTWESRTVVKSFDVTGGQLKPVSEINLGGYVTDIQATPAALLVARYDWNGDGSDVAIIDINNPNGSMVEGDTIDVAGYVRNQFNMDLYGGILRVVSGSWWGGDSTNHLQTYDATDFNNLVPIDHVTFGDNEDLYATLFLGHKAFFVTYRRTDPFHAFEIDANGYATEMSEFVISGWNDFFKPVLDETRLIGIGVDDTAGWSMAVSLYDITDLTNPDPLVERIEVGTGYSWSEARWDHRAFSVLDGVVDAVGPNGEAENGLVLLPFSGWSDSYETYTAGVQVYTFSADSLTKRDVMVHGTPVRRSFLADDDLTGNLSEAELSFFDTSEPDECVELGRVELAPNYTDFLMFGDYAARVKNSREYYYWWWGGNAELPEATVEMISRTEHPDIAEPIASFGVPSDADIHQTGTKVVSVTTRYVEGSSYPDYEYESTIDIHDVSNPAQPTHTATLITDRLNPGYNYWPGYWYDDCWDCGGYYYGSYNQQVEEIPGGLVFLQRRYHNELEGTEHACYTYADEYGDCYDEGWEDGCYYYNGSIDCRSLDGGPELCTGQIQRCEYYSNGDWDCEPIDPSSIETREYCYDYQRYRYWQSFSLEVLDLTDPADPVLATVVLPDEEEGVSMLANGSDVWISYRQPVTLAGDSLPYVRYFIKRIDLSNPSQPSVDSPVNVPGELLFIEGNTIFTRDLVWGDNIIETSIARLALHNGLAYLQAIRNFTDQWVEAVKMDGAGHILLSHRNSWYTYYDSSLNTDEEVEEDYSQHLSILDAGSNDLGVLVNVVVDDWAYLKEAKVGRALFQVPGGILVFNLDDATAPYPQAYFPTRGWPRQVMVDDDDIILPAGRYGIYEFDMNSFNLLDPSL